MTTLISHAFGPLSTMLRTIPNLATAFANDGILPASAIGLAVRAECIEDFARKRARVIVDKAEVDAKRLREKAGAEGFTQGYSDALEVLVPQVRMLLSQEALLRDAMMLHLRDTLVATLRSMDFEDALIVRWCEMHRSNATGRPVLYMPAQYEELVCRLRRSPALDEWDIRRGECAFPVLEAGHLVLEFDPKRQLLREVELSLADAGVVQGVKQRADDYVKTLIEHINAKAIRVSIKATDGAA
ncbi:hypothetical protein [Dyella sp. Tek66A03]|uniref:hypothetical protein n=1 Tax=Dyella sp. Tek66A03 TaxID=3458298 RepID=UPI00403E5EF6